MISLQLKSDFSPLFHSEQRIFFVFLKINPINSFRKFSYKFVTFEAKVLYFIVTTHSFWLITLKSVAKSSFVNGVYKLIKIFQKFSKNTIDKFINLEYNIATGLRYENTNPE